MVLDSRYGSGCMFCIYTRILMNWRFTQTIRGIQGAMIISGSFQMVMGFLGLWRNAARFLSPLCGVPCVTFTGLGLYHLGFPMLASAVEVGLPALISMVFISQASIMILNP
ncbi:nucleobase-ascorbate transporter 10-like protein [Trifolium pratense]|uniref:Nucleobase-ascorbate transporter 10-like protein n=1 Tax=Trifolium pratense TaxID=57577 RepID=A0A2K3JPL4_TRIPR|nr:nucleobase-ascorbate transporter 10-like protein [Trifolium pratense]